MNPKILIPLIRKVLPTIVAKDIIGIQPMTTVKSKPNWVASHDTHNMYPYAAIDTNFVSWITDDFKDKTEWCSSMFAPGSWHSCMADQFRFTNKDDMLLFILRWAK